MLKFNRFYLIVLILISTCIVANAEPCSKLPFGTEWGQTQAEVKQTMLRYGYILEERNNTLYHVIPPKNGYSSSSHFIFNDEGRLYWIMLFGICDNAQCFVGFFNKVYKRLETSGYTKMYSDGKASHTYFDNSTNSFVGLKGTKKFKRYIVLLEFEQAERAPIK